LRFMYYLLIAMRFKFQPAPWKSSVQELLPILVKSDNAEKQRSVKPQWASFR